MKICAMPAPKSSKSDRGVQRTLSPWEAVKELLE
jgi:hypothetical protein